MSMDRPTLNTTALVERVRALILKPSSEWDRIAAEPARIDTLYAGYLGPLAGGMAALVLVLSVILSAFTLLYPLLNAVYFLIGALVGTFVLAIVINALAPQFGAQPDEIAAHKVAVYSMTPALLAHIFAIHIAILPLSVVGLYSFWLLYLGLPKLMKPPEEKRNYYFVTIVLVSLAASMVFGGLMNVVGFGWGGRYYAPLG